MKFDMAKLNEEIETGMVNKQSHPTLPLFIHKYSQECVFTRHWNETTMRCRGLVLDEMGNIVINCMPKFFNHSEQDGQPVYEAGKKIGVYSITEKMDGSLIQVTKWNDELIVTSSGSFTSPQAIKATELIQPFVNEITKGNTYVFELIYPQNRIVINYGDLVQLTLLAVRDTDTGHEYPLDLESDKFVKVKNVGMRLEEIEAELSQAEYVSKEGYVVRFNDGTRIKLKYLAYMKLHKLVSGVNETFVWESLKNGIDLEKALEGIPDELFEFVQKTSDDLNKQFKEIEYKAVAINQALSTFNNRKEQAKWLLDNYKDLAHIVFCMLDGKDYSEKIWKDIKPKASTVSMFGRGES